MLLRKSRSPADYTAALDTAVWIVQLRWFAIVGQCAAISVTAWLFQIPLPLGWLGAAVSITVITNIALMVYLFLQRRQDTDDWKSQLNPLGDSEISSEVPSADTARAVTKIAMLENLLGSSLLVDVVTLTAMLYLTGGIANPFSCFYFANIAICGLILAPRWTWAVSGLSVLGIAFLLVDSRELMFVGFAEEAELPFWSIRKQGNFVALSACCIVVTYFINVLMAELRNRELRLANAETQRTRSQRLEAMATLAAGAGHELASPLSTIAVVAKELSRKLDKPDVPKNITRDVDLIRSELDRCRDVLSRMKSGAGEASAEGFREVAPEQLAKAIIEPLRQPERIEYKSTAAQKNPIARLPLQALSQAIRNLVQNALDASPPDAKVLLQFEINPLQWTILVSDNGTGMDPETVDRIGQPFFTTKSVGQGMGLGVFLTRNVVRGLGGQMHFESRIELGTTVRVEIPMR